MLSFYAAAGLNWPVATCYPVIHLKHPAFAELSPALACSAWQGHACMTAPGSAAAAAEKLKLLELGSVER